MTGDIKTGGTFLINTNATTVEALEEFLPAKVKQDLAKKKINLYVIKYACACLSVWSPIILMEFLFAPTVPSEPSP